MSKDLPNNIVLFPEVFQQLQHELYTYHRELAERFEGCTDKDFPSRLGYLAGLVDIVVDGYYTPEEILGLAERILTRLRELSTPVIILEAPRLIIAKEKEDEDNSNG